MKKCKNVAEGEAFEVILIDYSATIFINYNTIPEIYVSI